MIFFNNLFILFVTFLFIIRYNLYHFKYNDKIIYFDVDISNNRNLVNIIEKNGTKKDPLKNFNNSSGTVLNFYDISNHCHEYIDKFYIDTFLNEMKNLVNEPKLCFIDSEKDPLSIAIQLYKEGDFMSDHFDTNFSLGTRYTIVIPLYINEKNDCYLHIKDVNNIKKKIPISIGQGIIYNGDKVYHSVSKQCKDGERITLIINLTTNKNYNYIGKILQKIRNYLFEKYTW